MTDSKKPEAAFQEEVRRTIENAQDVTARSANAMREMMTAGSDMAFDAILRNWNYSRSLRNTVEQAIEETLRTQHRITNEMLDVWQGYSNTVQDIATRAVKKDEPQS